MPDKRYTIELTKHELAHVIVGLDRAIKTKKDGLRKAQKRQQETGRSAPGAISGRAMELAELTMTRERLVKFWTDEVTEKATQPAAQAGGV